MKAIKTFESAARNDKTCAEAFKGIGMSYMKLGYSENSTDLGLVENAASAFQKALQLNPNMPDIIYQLGLAYLALDNKPGAEKQQQALVSISKHLADQLAVRISVYKAPKNYHITAESMIESGGPSYARSNCGQGESWNSATNTCARSTSPGEVAERYSREEMARQDRESREKTAQEDQKLTKKLIRAINNSKTPAPAQHIPSEGQVMPGGQVILY
jgi:tetratricopeptide (TPR) repeat protein